MSGWSNVNQFSTTNNTAVVYSNGIIQTNYGDKYDKTTFKWNDLPGYLSALPAASYYKTGYPDSNATGTTLSTYYTKLATQLQAEYNFYFGYYKSALGLLVGSLATPANPVATADQQRNLLQHVIEMNARLNALIELVSYLANQETARTQTLSGQINNLNNSISQNQSLRVSTQFLQNSDSLLTTRKEMIRYTSEKNNHITNQISLWAALNVLAIGTIFAIYRSM